MKLRLPRDRRINGMGPRQPIQLQIPSLSQHSQIRAQALLSRFQSRCGCAAGALVMLVSLVVGIMKVYDRNGVALSWPVLWESAVVLLAAFVIECKQWADRWTRGCQDWAENVRRVCDDRLRR